jgi:PAS domain S-box-containing protein
MSRKPTYEQLEQKIRELEARHRQDGKDFETNPDGRKELQAIIDLLPAMIFAKDREGRFILANKATADSYNLTVDELVGKYHADLHPDEAEATHMLADDRKVIDRGRPLFIPEESYRDASGHTRYLQTTKVPFRSALSPLPAIIGIAQDITERRQAAEEMRDSKQMLQLVMDNIPQFIFWKNRECVYLGCNHNFARAAGVAEPAAIAGKTDHDLAWKKEEADFFRECDRRVMETDTPEYHIIEPQLQAGGRQAWLDTNKIPLHDADGRVVGILGTYEDITERIKAQETLELYEKIVATTNDLMSIIAPDYVYLAVNDAYLDAHRKNREDIVGHSAAELMGGEVFTQHVQPRLDQALAGKQVQYDAWFDYPGRGRRYMSISYNPFRDEHQLVKGVVVNAHDITRIQQLETKLIQAQKLEAVGTLAGGLAHDFNNLLMGIQGRASLLATEMDASHPLLEHVKGIEEYVRSATGLTNQLLGFARGGKYEVKPTDPNRLVDKTAGMFGRTKKEIRIHRTFATDAWGVETDRRQMEQVLLNLFVNAWQAMPGGGDLYLGTENMVLDETITTPHLVAPGRYVKISATDTGVGMDESTRQRIFDPFFTTKTMGRGTGLGLASAYGIVKNHEGFINVYSELGKGTTFNIYLPASDRDVHREATAEPGFIKGSGTVLLVDDEDMIIDVGKAMLEKLGYHVLVAMDGLQAIDAIQRKENQIDLVILDMIMPEMDGGEAFDRIREIQPTMPVLLSSGYSLNGRANDIMQRGCDGFIQKPFNLNQLSQKVRNILDATNDAAPGNSAETLNFQYRP